MRKSSIIIHLNRTIHLTLITANISCAILVTAIWRCAILDWLEVLGQQNLMVERRVSWPRCVHPFHTMIRSSLIEFLPSYSMSRHDGIEHLKSCWHSSNTQKLLICKSWHHLTPRHASVSYCLSPFSLFFQQVVCRLYTWRDALWKTNVPRSWLSSSDQSNLGRPRYSNSGGILRYQFEEIARLPESYAF